MQVNWFKFILLALALIGLFTSLIVGVATWAEIAGPVGLIIGYGAGNGVQAYKGEGSANLFRPPPPNTHESNLERKS